MSKIHNAQDLREILLQPTPGGSWRPFSDRGYYLLLQSIFGATPVPFHIACFLTQFINLALVFSITRRLTGSDGAAFLAPLLWIANSKLLLVMAWCLAYDYALCGMCLLGSFWLFLRWIDTDARRYYVGMWIVFLLGFGVLETNLVFPMLAAAYAWLCARAYFKKTLPLFIPSIAFLAAHMLMIHAPASGPYRMHFTSAMVRTFIRYWAWDFEPVNLTTFTHLPETVGIVGMLLFSGALLTFVAFQAYRRNFVPVFFFCWFVIVLAPALPLRDNIQDVYLALPCIGVAMLGASAFVWAWKRSKLYQSLAVALLLLFLVESVPTDIRGIEWYRERSLRVENLVETVVAKHAENPGKIILLTGIDAPLFYASVNQRAFAAFGVNDVYLAPGSETEISPGDPAVAQFVLPAARMQDAVAHRAVVLQSKDGHVTDVTAQYALPELQQPQAQAMSTRVDAGDPQFQNQLGPEWYAIDQGFRWMPMRATVRLRGPIAKGQKLIVSGYCPALQTAKGPLGLQVSLDDFALRPVEIEKGDAPFSFEFSLPEDARAEITLRLEVERTFSTPADQRTLGLAFGTFEIR
ncbi:MAG TPA: hypothetical protein VKT81_28465 [Bryobacteraceae bacterium]|nr:hypothetical protein [Bryobacteraceae bacterium]